MTPDDFTATLEAELQLAGRPFDRSAVQAFVADCWPLMEESPCPEFRAAALLEQGNNTTKLSSGQI